MGIEYVTDVNTERSSDRRVFVAMAKPSKHILVTVRSNTVNNAGQYGLPGGHVDEHQKETILHAAEREVHEETGIRLELDRLSYVKTNRGKRFIIMVALNHEPVVRCNHEVAHHHWMTVEEIKAIPKEKLHRSLAILLDFEFGGSCDEEKN